MSTSTYVMTKMGLMKKKSSVDPKYCRPQGLYSSHNLNLKKLKKLILAGKLAPCYPGQEGAEVAPDAGSDKGASRASVSKGTYAARGYGDIVLDECPICFLNYPYLNVSRCCKACICTECFLQVKAPVEGQSVQCPFCKSPGYSVEFRGQKTEAERVAQQKEEAEVAAAVARNREHLLAEERDREKRILERRQSTGTEGPSTPSAQEPRGRTRNGSDAVDVPEGWEEEYAAMTPQVPDPEARRGRWVNSPPTRDELRRARHEYRGRISSRQQAARDAAVDERELMRQLADRRQRRGRSGMRRQREAEGVLDAMDPAYLRRIQDFVPAHLLNNAPDEALMAAGDLDMEDLMVMEALYLSLQEQEQREEGEPADSEDAEIAAAIAQIAAAERAEREERRDEDDAVPTAEDIATGNYPRDGEDVDEDVDEYDEDTDDERASADAAVQAITALRMSSSASRHSTDQYLDDIRQMHVAGYDDDEAHEEDEEDDYISPENLLASPRRTSEDGAYAFGISPAEVPMTGQYTNHSPADVLSAAADATDRTANMLEESAENMDRAHDAQEASLRRILQTLTANADAIATLSQSRARDAAAREAREEVEAFVSEELEAEFVSEELEAEFEEETPAPALSPGDGEMSPGSQINPVSSIVVRRPSLSTGDIAETVRRVVAELGDFSPDELAEAQASEEVFRHRTADIVSNVVAQLGDFSGDEVEMSRAEAELHRHELAESVAQAVSELADFGWTLPPSSPTRDDE